MPWRVIKGIVSKYVTIKKNLTKQKNDDAAAKVVVVVFFHSYTKAFTHDAPSIDPFPNSDGNSFAVVDCSWPKPDQLHAKSPRFTFSMS